MKKGDQRRQTIIRTAEELFYEKGYENTSVQDVLDVLHLSKGGFYHHFESKLKLLEAICAEQIETACEYAKSALENADNDPVSKLNTLLSHIGLLNQESMDFIGLIVRVAYANEGALLRDSMKRGYVQGILPLLQDIVLDGIDKGVFASAYPDRVAEMLLYLGACLTDDIGFLMVEKDFVPVCAPEILEKVNAYRGAAEAILNAPFGSIDLYDIGKLIELTKELQLQKEKFNKMNE